MCCITPFAPLKRVWFVETVQEAIFPGKIRKITSSGIDLIILERWSSSVNKTWPSSFKNGWLEEQSILSIYGLRVSAEFGTKVGKGS